MKAVKLISVSLLILCLVCGLCACNNGGTGSTPDSSVTDDSSAPVQEESSQPMDDKVTYLVKVVDQQNNPVAGAMVQLCLDTCVPALTGEDGVATFVMDEAEYKVSFAAMPEGYTSEETEFYFEDDATELTITLTATE
ncbi:MAG: hypothetical protein IKU51_04530 [Clostridia bacterium]|nr:hypothetical protein [Clostridia bacterium]